MRRTRASRTHSWGCNVVQPRWGKVWQFLKSDQFRLSEADARPSCTWASSSRVKARGAERGRFSGEGGSQPQGRADLGPGSRRRLVSQSRNVTLPPLMPCLRPGGKRPPRPGDESHFGGRGLTSGAFERSRPVCARLGTGLGVRCRIWAGAGRAGSRALRNRGVCDLRGARAGELGSRPCGPATGVSLGPWSQ